MTKMFERTDFGLDGWLASLRDVKLLVGGRLRYAS